MIPPSRYKNPKVVRDMLLTLILFMLPLAAVAHKPSDSYLTLNVTDVEVKGQWDIALRDINYAIGLDTNDDGAITWDELSIRDAELGAYALSRLRLTTNTVICALSKTALLVDRHSDGTYAVLRFTGICPAPIQNLGIEYSLFFDLDSLHRGLTSINADGITRTTIFSPERANQQFDLETSAPLRQLLSFVYEGFRHIGSGFDHQLFLLALLLPAMFTRIRHEWQPVTRFTDAFWSVFKIVTSFTVAHSVTLSLAALQIITLPSRWVEIAIAISVLLAALNNIFPVVHRQLWLVAFLFGLIHGFGFAGVLVEMELPRSALLLSLLGFNLGVELGQLVIVVIYFLAAYGIRSTRTYRYLLMPGGSSLIAAVSLFWIAERAFGSFNLS